MRLSYRSLLFAAAAVGLATLAAALFLHKPRYRLDSPRAMVIEALPIKTGAAKDTLGEQFYLSPQLSYRGGVVLSAAKELFGGWSAISVTPDLTRLLAISDTGNWLQSTITWDAGTISGLVESTIGPLLDATGSPVNGTGNGDLESLSVGPDKVYVGFESFRSGIWLADRAPEFSSNRYSAPPLPDEIGSLRKGRGIEALARISLAGMKEPVVLVIAERNPAGDASKTPAWLLSDDGDFSLVKAFDFPTADGFDVSDVAFDRSCGLFVLERKLGWSGRFFARLVKVNLARRDGVVTQTQEILFAGDSSGAAIDNMEGLAVVPTGHGVCAMLMISDDNFLPLQKTVLLNFEYRL